LNEEVTNAPDNVTDVSVLDRWFVALTLSATAFLAGEIAPHLAESGRLLTYGIAIGWLLAYFPKETKRRVFAIGAALAVLLAANFAISGDSIVFLWIAEASVLAPISVSPPPCAC